MNWGNVIRKYFRRLGKKPERPLGVLLAQYWVSSKDPSRGLWESRGCTLLWRSDFTTLEGQKWSYGKLIAMQMFPLPSNWNDSCSEQCPHILSCRQYKSRKSNFHQNLFLMFSWFPHQLMSWIKSLIRGKFTFVSGSSCYLWKIII